MKTRLIFLRVFSLNFTFISWFKLTAFLTRCRPNLESLKRIKGNHAKQSEETPLEDFVMAKFVMIL
jgi:hypothetical protein